MLCFEKVYLHIFLSLFKYVYMAIKIVSCETPTYQARIEEKVGKFTCTCCCTMLLINLHGPNDGSYIYKQLSFHYYFMLTVSVNGTHNYDNSHDGEFSTINKLFHVYIMILMLFTCTPKSIYYIFIKYCFLQR